MPDNADKPNEPIDLAAHRERRARLRQQQIRLRAAAQASREARRNDAADHASDSGSDPDSAPAPLPAAPLAPGEVPCAHCGEPVYGHALRCPHCGVHFSGGADAFAPKEGMPRRTRLIVALVAVALLLAGLSDDIAAWWWALR